MEAVMKIWKHLRPENIFFDAVLPDKDAALRFVADVCVRNCIVSDADALYNGLQQRERTMSTGIGDGIAFPHTTHPDARQASVLLIRPSRPIEFDSLDSLPVDIILSIVIPEHQTALHLQILAGIARLCKNREILKTVRESRESDLLWEAIRALEEKMAFH